MAKVALLIGVSTYADGLAPLPSAVRDVNAMQRVLSHPAMGAFDQVKLLLDPEPVAMQEAIELLFASTTKDDLVLLFFSGHGVKDENGRLFFATRLTRKNAQGTLVKATAVPASFIQDVMSQARCKRQVVMLDCCFSGAFAEGMTAKDDDQVDVQAQLGGEGRVVLTSSTATQYAFEQAGAELSIYTRYLVEGIETGAADSNDDGWISVDELHDFARKKVQESAPAMKPKIFAVEEGYSIVLAIAPVSDPRLKYRKEAEKYASQGEFSLVGRRILTALRDKLELSAEVAIAIEAEVLKPFQEYRHKLHQYKETLREAIAQEYPLSPRTLAELKDLQRLFGLRDADLEPIQRQLLAPVTPTPIASTPTTSTPLASTPSPALGLMSTLSTQFGATAAEPPTLPDVETRRSLEAAMPQQARVTTPPKCGS